MRADGDVGEMALLTFGSSLIDGAVKQLIPKGKRRCYNS
jgi:hypothetical protein